MVQKNKGKGDLTEQEEKVWSLFPTPSLASDGQWADTPVNVQKLNGQHNSVNGVKPQNWAQMVLQSIIFVHEHITYSF